MKRVLLALMLSTAITGCALDQQSAPNLAGPSELGLSLAMTATPDSLLQNGQAQSTVSIVARDSAGNPLAGRQFYVRSRVNNTINIGTLSAPSVTTDSQGRASVIYTAPDLSAGTNFNYVMIEFLPVGTNADNNSDRFLTIRMIR
jgi:hypothetical protein